MGTSQDLFSKSLTGYSRQQVNAYLDEINSEEEAEVLELKEKIKNTLLLNEELAEEIEKIKKHRELNGKTEEYRDFLMERLENIEESMKLDAKNDIRFIKEEAREKEISMENEISNLNRFFKNIQDNLDILIKTVIVKNEPKAESGFRVIPYKGRTGNKKMLQNDNERENKQLTQNNIFMDVNDVDEIRNRYIVGKLAGEDITDEAGGKIISKDSVITEELVQKAESAGKLSELIIKMAVPEGQK